MIAFSSGVSLQHEIVSYWRQHRPGSRDAITCHVVRLRLQSHGSPNPTLVGRRCDFLKVAPTLLKQ